MYLPDEFRHNIGGMTTPNQSFAIDSGRTNLCGSFTKNLSNFVKKLLGRGASGICNQYNCGVQRDGLDRGNHVADNKRGSAGLALRYGIWNQVLEISQVGRHDNLVRSREYPTAELPISFSDSHKSLP
jgi:hypothetical protein